MRHKAVIGVVIFFVISSIAGWTLNGTVNLREQRALAKMPDISINNLLDDTFYLELEQYINDHFVLRSFLIKTKGWIDYNLFNSSVDAKVLIGKNGWFFYRDELRDYSKNDCSDRERMRTLARELQTLEKVFAKSGKIFLFIVAPNKSTIYPEYVGFNVSNSGCNKSRYDLLMESFILYPVKGFIRLDQKLILSKKNEPVFFKMDSHWNANGAMIVSRSVLEYLRPESWDKYFPDVEIAKQYMGGDLANMTALNYRNEEDVIKGVSYRAVVNVENKEPLKNGWPRFRITTKSSSTPLLPRAIFYRDSFMTHPLELLKGSFSQIDVYWDYDLSISEAMEDLRTSKIVIMEVVERNLGELKIDSKAVESLLQG